MKCFLNGLKASVLLVALCFFGGNLQAQTAVTASTEAMEVVKTQATPTASATAVSGDTETVTAAKKKCSKKCSKACSKAQAKNCTAKNCDPKNCDPSKCKKAKEAAGSTSTSAVEKRGRV